eukprot:UN13491
MISPFNYYLEEYEYVFSTFMKMQGGIVHVLAALFPQIISLQSCQGKFPKIVFFCCFFCYVFYWRVVWSRFVY